MSLVDIRNLYLNLGWSFYLVRQRQKEYRYNLFDICKSRVLDYRYTFTAEECLSADKIEFDILSNEILKKGPAQTDKSLYILYQSDSYSSTAAYAVERSTMGIQNHSFLMLFYQLYCFFTCQMLDVKADHQHRGKPTLHLLVHAFIITRIVAITKFTKLF